MPARRQGSRPVLAGATAMLPMGVLLASSLLFTSTRATGSPVVALGPTFSATVVAVVAAALVSVLSGWLSPTSTRLALTACAAVTAAGTAYIVMGQAGLSPALSALVAALAGALWARLVFGFFALDPVSRAELIDRIPERDRVGVRPSPETVAASTAEAAPWDVQLRSVRMQRLSIYGAVVFGAVLAFSLGSTPLWWVVVIVVAGSAFCAAMAAWSAVQMSIDQRGLTIRSLRAPVDLVKVAPAEIVGVSSVEIDPLEWGGWGLQWNARHTAYIRSGGPGLVVYRRSGRPLAVEIPEGSSTAEAGAVLLRRIAGRAGST
ncbi:MAG: hypothetical protein WA962_01605 [Ornithinimicrobium sp.]